MILSQPLEPFSSSPESEVLSPLKYHNANEIYDPQG